ncbi:hypothetical protein [Legionella brunensis]|nr:hypothetical protein [Legionella brunensis]
MLNPIKVTVENNNKLLIQYFELEPFFKYLKSIRKPLSPLYHLPIVNIELDSELKSEIDLFVKENDIERYEQVNPQLQFQQLQELIQTLKNPENASFFANWRNKNLLSNTIVGGSVSAFLSLAMFSDEIRIPVAIFTAMVGAFASYEISLLDAPNYNFFSGMRKVPERLSEIRNELNEINPEVWGSMTIRG